MVSNTPLGDHDSPEKRGRTFAAPRPSSSTFSSVSSSASSSPAFAWLLLLSGSGSNAESVASAVIGPDHGALRLGVKSGAAEADLPRDPPPGREEDGGLKAVDNAEPDRNESARIKPLITRQSARKCAGLVMMQERLIVTNTVS
jgi:hypothetical protein